jgi:hypothetical protein
MFRILIPALAAAALATPALASEKPTEEETTRIMALLKDMQCEMDEADIEKSAEGFELDDVFCADGQFDIELDTDFEVVEKRKE